MDRRRRRTDQACLRELVLDLLNCWISLWISSTFTQWSSSEVSSASCLRRSRISIQSELRTFSSARLGSGSTPRETSAARLCMSSRSSVCSVYRPTGSSRAGDEKLWLWMEAGRGSSELLELPSVWSVIIRIRKFCFKQSFSSVSSHSNNLLVSDLQSEFILRPLHLHTDTELSAHYGFHC